MTYIQSDKLLRPWSNRRNPKLCCTERRNENLKINKIFIEIRLHYVILGRVCCLSPFRQWPDWRLVQRGLKKRPDTFSLFRLCPPEHPRVPICPLACKERVGLQCPGRWFFLRILQFLRLPSWFQCPYRPAKRGLR